MMILQKIVNKVTFFIVTKLLPRTLPVGSNVRYVSNSATNGFVVGSNANSGLTKTTPWLTPESAHSQAAAGIDIILNDGTYQMATFLHIVKPQVWWSYSNLGVAFTGLNGSRVINIAGNLAANGLSFNEIVIDSERNSTYCVTTTTPGDVLVHDITFRRVLFKNPTFNYIKHFSTIQDLVLFFCSGTNTGNMRSGIDATDHTEGTIRVHGWTVDNPTTSGGDATIRIIGKGLLAKVEIRRLNARVNVPASTIGVFTHYGVYIDSVSDLIVESNSISMRHLKVPPDRSLIGVRVSAENVVGSLNADNVRVEDNIIDIDNFGGICIQIGTDNGAVDSDNKTNDPVVRGNKLYFKNTQSGHGILVGNSQGGLVTQNRVDGCFNSVLSKGQKGNTQRTVISFNKVTNTYGTGESLRIKGSDNVDVEDNESRLENGFAGRFIYVTENDDTTPSLGNTISRNRAHNDGSMTGKMVEVLNTNVAIFNGNNYHSDSALPLDPFVHTGTAYQNVTEWNTDPSVSNETEDDIEVTI